MVSVSLAMIAYAIDVEALGTTAALGAFFAPLLLGRNYANADPAPDVSRLDGGGTRTGGGAAALASHHVRCCGELLRRGLFRGRHRGTPWAVCSTTASSGNGWNPRGLRERWWETRLLSFSGGWTFVAAASDRLHHHWAILLAVWCCRAGVVVRTPLHRILPVQLPTGSVAPGWSLGEALYFFLTPILLGWAVHGLDPGWFDGKPGAVALLVALPYLIAGYQRPRPAFALVGAAAAGIAAWQHWDGVGRVWALLALALLWAALDHLLVREDGRWFALGTLWAALDHLFGEALARRIAADSAFVGAWAVDCGRRCRDVGLAAGLWRRVGAASAAALIRVGSGPRGAMVFRATGEIQRYFALKTLSVQDREPAPGCRQQPGGWCSRPALVMVVFRRAPTGPRCRLGVAAR